MLLAFNINDIIRIPFGYLLDWLYQFTTSYGLALILFAIIVKLILMPITAKSKKSMMKMSRLTPRIQEIKNKYPNDQQKQNEAIQALQKEEGATMGCGGCLWSLIPLLILFPLYYVIRQPLQYMLHLTVEEAETIVKIVSEHMPDLIANTNGYYSQVLVAPYIQEFAAEIREALPNISEQVLEGLNFTFLGVDLGLVPTFNIFGSAWSWDWSHIGGFLIPVLSAGSQVLSMFISQKMNNSVVTDEKGLEDKEAAKNSQAAQTNKIMMWTMPLMSLWIGFTVPAALSLYWLIQGVVSIAIDAYLTKKYRKIYDAEDAERLKKAMELEAIEAEKERLRAEKRAANPDGITENTSKKKLQKKQQQAEEAAKAAAKKDYDARKGNVTEEESAEESVMSGIPSRPYCKGRAYDPNRYNSDSSEE